MPSPATCMWDECGALADGAYEVYIGERPGWSPDAYLRTLRRVPVAAYTWVPLCGGHLGEFGARSELALEPDLWSPQGAHPAVFPIRRR